MGLKKSIGLDHPHTLKCEEAYAYLVEYMRQNSEAENASVIGEDS